LVVETAPLSKILETPPSVSQTAPLLKTPRAPSGFQTAPLLKASHTQSVVETAAPMKTLRAL
jgi:hypothetical protein